MSKTNPSRSNRPSAPPYVDERSYTVTRWPATASRAAAAMAPTPAPITAIRAMSATVSPPLTTQSGSSWTPAAASRFSSRRCALRRRKRRILRHSTTSITMPSTSSVPSNTVERSATGFSEHNQRQQVGERDDPQLCEHRQSDQRCGVRSVHGSDPHSRQQHLPGGGDAPSGKAQVLAKAVGAPLPSILYDGVVDPRKKQLAGDARICIENNAGATFLNYDAAHEFKNPTRDLAPHTCSLPALPAVALTSGV